MRKSKKNLGEILAEVANEEDLKFEFLKFMNLKPSSKKFVDLYTEQILFEFKFNANLKNPHELAKCVAQTLYYIRRLKFGRDNRPLSQKFLPSQKKSVIICLRR